jgi:hypothetical protein
VFRAQTLDGNDAIEPRVIGFPHLAHAASADSRDESIWPDRLAAGPLHAQIVSGGSRKNRLLGGARPAGCAVPPHAHNRVPAKLYQGRVDLIVTLGSIDATPASASLRAAREADGKSDLYFAGATVS